MRYLDKFSSVISGILMTRGTNVSTGVEEARPESKLNLDPNKIPKMPNDNSIDLTGIKPYVSKTTSSAASAPVCSDDSCDAPLLAASPSGSEAEPQPPLPGILQFVTELVDSDGKQVSKEVVAGLKDKVVGFVQSAACSRRQGLNSELLEIVL
jgi:hypothetical protein